MSGERVVRPTLRVLVELGLVAPGVEASLADVEHSVLAKARQFAPSFPQNLIRIKGIDDEMVYRFTHGRTRAVAWLDEATEIVWVCACELRDDETYDDIIELHRKGELLPGDADDVRLAREAALLLGREMMRLIPGWMRETRERVSREQRFLLNGTIEIRMLVLRDQGVEEFWLAMPTLHAEVPGLTPNARAMLAALVERELGEQTMWEQRYDWPTGTLRSYEIARLGIGGT